VARTFTKNLANHLSLGVNAIGPIINGAGTILTVAQLRPASFDTSTGDNSVLAAYITSAQLGLGLNISGPTSVTRGTAKTNSGDALQNRVANSTVSTGAWHTIASFANFPNDSIHLYLDGPLNSDPLGPVTFVGTAYTQGSPTVPDRIGRTNNEQTNQQFAGDIEYLAIWLGRTQTQAANITSALQAGTKPYNIVPAPVFCMVLGYATPDVDLVAGVIQSTITGSLPFIEGPTGLPGTPVDQTASGVSSDPDTFPKTAELTTTGFPRLLLGAIGIGRHDAIVTQDPDFKTNVPGTETDGSGLPSENVEIFVGDRITSVIETRDYGVSMDKSSAWVAGLVAYKALESGGTPFPQITSVLELEVTAGENIFYVAEASHDPISFTAENLPAGVTFEDTGELSGSIATPDVYHIGLAAINETGTGPTATLVLTVVPASPAPPAGVFKSKPVPVALQLALGQAYQGSGRSRPQ
jgi:hypothetical protein